MLCELDNTCRNEGGGSSFTAAQAVGVGVFAAPSHRRSPRHQVLPTFKTGCTAAPTAMAHFPLVLVMRVRENG